jgi:hypothetical protein
VVVYYEKVTGTKTLNRVVVVLMMLTVDCSLGNLDSALDRAVNRSKSQINAKNP